MTSYCNDTASLSDNRRCGPLAYSSRVEVNQSHVSNRYNHVHHAAIVRLLEEGRNQFLESLGFSLEKFLERDLFIVISSLSVQYRREVRLGEAVVTCESPLVRGRKVSVGQRVLIEGGRREAVRAEVELLFVSAKTRKAVSPPADFTKAWSTPRKPRLKLAKRPSRTV